VHDNTLWIEVLCTQQYIYIYMCVCVCVCVCVCTKGLKRAKDLWHLFRRYNCIKTSVLVE
jgi:hypothetical protein